jgi:hypothetical protein
MLIGEKPNDFLFFLKKQKQGIKTVSYRLKPVNKIYVH